MRRFTFILTLIGLCALGKLQAAEITVPGVSGITFDDAVPSVTITNDFTIHGLNISPQGLTLSYASDVFKLYGTATVKIGSDNITVSFGDEASPGLEVTSGTFTQVSMGLTADFSLKGVDFSPTTLSFEWDNANSVFEIYGSAGASFDSETMNLTLGDAATPGITITNGGLTQISLGFSGDFTMKSLSFSPVRLTFQWDSGTDKFEMFGGADVSFDSETITVGLGDADNPGIEIGSGTIEKVNLSASSNFTIKDIQFSSASLTLQWDSSTDKIEMFGGSDISFDSETMTVGLGDEAAPGIEIGSGTIEKINFTVSGDFTIKSIGFSPASLTFQWDSTTGNFEMFGGADVSFDSETITVGLGDADNPGLEIGSGTIEKVNLSVSSNFTIKDIQFSSASLTLQWDSSTDKFEMFGGSDISFDSETMTVGLGDETAPGIEIGSGTIEKINFSVNGDFTIKSIGFSPASLTFQWDSTTGNFEMFGGADVSFDSETITVGLGDADNPGLEIGSGTIEKVNLSVSSNFTIKDIQFSSASLTLQWDSSSDKFEMFGGSDVSFDSETMTVGLGDEAAPGIEIGSGTIEKINFTVSGDFTIKSIGFSPASLTFQWDSTTGNFEMFGGADVSFDSETITVGLGDADNPGLEIGSGTIEKVNLSVSSSFNIKDIQFSSASLTLQWDSSTDKFEMFGGSDVSFDSETMTVGLGDADAPGIEIGSGTIEKINFTVSGEFTIKSIGFTPASLTFQWDSTTDEFEMFGDATVTFDSETVAVSLGDADSPGLAIKAGVVEQINFGLTTDFSLKSMDFKADGLTFKWDKASNQFEIFGNTTVTFDGETVAVSLGNDADPGIEIMGGLVDHINLGVTTDFTLRNISFAVDALTFQWDKAGNYFEMYGVVEATFDGETARVSLGNDSDPGLKIQNNELQHINMSVLGTFDMKDISFTAEDLGFVWDKATNHFLMFGGASVTFDSETVSVSLGNSSDPGILIVNNVIEHINMGITADFELKTMSFKADGLTFEWDKASDHFEMFGNTSTTFEGETISVSLGDNSDPGIVIQHNAVQHINMGITADFTLKTMEFEADGLTYHWDKSANQFEIYGSTTAKFDGESVSISLGNNSDPGIAVKNNRIQHINMGVTADINLKAMTVKPDNLTFHYDRGSSHFEMYGSADLTVEGHDAGVSMGTNANPGLIFKNGVLEQINMAITEDFSLKGLTVKTDNLGVEWVKGSNHFNFYGDIQLDIANENIEADMGTSSDPGMQFRNGKLHSMDVTVNSDFKIGNLEVTTRDVEVKYISSKFYMTGEVEVDEVWSVIVDLGQDGSNGLEIDASHHPDKLKLNSFKIEVDHVDLGAIDFKKVEISFQNDVIHDAELDVSIPPGYEVDAKMTFAGSPAKLNSIDIAFDATNFDSAIPVGDTGIELVHLEGGMFNLANPGQRVTVFARVGAIQVPLYTTTGVYFQGSIGFTFGGPVSLAGHSAALLYQETDATVSGAGVFLGADLLIGAYRSGSHWRSILGDGSITMNLIWGRSYSVSAHMNIPSDPLVEFTAAAKLASNGTFDAFMDVKLKVPHSVPIVGGKTLGSVDGAVRYNKRDLNYSYGAGWASYWFFGRHHFGARYRFGPRKVDVIGSGTVNSIKSQVSREIGSTRSPHDFNGGAANPTNLTGTDGVDGTEETVWAKEIKTFEIPANKSSMFIEVDMGKVVDEAYVSVIGPDGFYDVYEVQKTEVADDEPPLMDLADRITKFESDSAVNLLVMNHAPENDSLQQHFSTLTPGQYDLLISYREDNNVDSVGIQASYFHPVPDAEISAEEIAGGLIDIDMEYWASMPDSTILSVFWNDTASYGGHEIATLDYGQADEAGFAQTNLVFNPSQSLHNDSIYFYYVLLDSTNAPYYSELTEPITIKSPINGSVVITNPDEESTVTGIMVFIDENGNGSYDTEGTNGAFEPHSITGEDGDFSFNNLVLGQTYTVDLVVPYGHSLADGEKGKRTFVYQGIAQTFTFNIKED